MESVASTFGLFLNINRLSGFIFFLHSGDAVTDDDLEMVAEMRTSRNAQKYPDRTQNKHMIMVIETQT